MYFKVYFILAHKKPAQIAKLISLLQDGKSLFFIHLDKNVAMNLFEPLQQLERCYFIKKRMKCNWGDYSLVQATLNGMMEVKEFMKRKKPNDDYHCILLSGEDLPLKTNEKIHNFLEGKRETSFIHHWKLPYEKWWNGGLFRFESLYFFDFIKHPKAHYWLNKLIIKLNLQFVFPINRIKKEYPDLELYGSSQWMIFSKKLMGFVLESSNKNAKFSRLFKYVLAPDELYFPTLINNFQKEKSFKIENIVTHLVVFEGAKANPQYLSIEDIQKYGTETTLFARKFDDNINGNSMAYIKTKLNQ